MYTSATRRYHTTLTILGVATLVYILIAVIVGAANSFEGEFWSSYGMHPITWRIMTYVLIFTAGIHAINFLDNTKQQISYWRTQRRFASCVAGFAAAHIGFLVLAFRVALGQIPDWDAFLGWTTILAVIGCLAFALIDWNDEYDSQGTIFITVFGCTVLLVALFTVIFGLPLWNNMNYWPNFSLWSTFWHASVYGLIFAGAVWGMNALDATDSGDDKRALRHLRPFRRFAGSAAAFGIMHFIVVVVGLFFELATDVNWSGMLGWTTLFAGGLTAIGYLIQWHDDAQPDNNHEGTYA